MSDFIEEIQFKEDFLPFAKKDKVFFGWESEIQRIIEFYLKGKPEDSYEWTAYDCAKRFKINCILANNWGGKSRLFEYALGMERPEGKFNKTLLDDFFVWTHSLRSSVNFDDISWYARVNQRNTYIWSNTIWAKLFYLGKRDINIIKWFFWNNFDKTFVWKFKRWPNNEYKVIISSKILDIWEWIKTKAQLQTSYWVSDLDIWYYLTSWYEYFKDKTEWLSHEEKAISTILYCLSKLKIRSKIIHEEAYTFFEQYSWNFNKRELFESEDAWEVDVLKLLESLYLIIEWEKNLPAFIVFTEYFFWWFDIGFKSKTNVINYHNFSAGEKMILLRFLNLYICIFNDSIEEYQVLTILIDEPDLHLHLDWQKKYIQKLIDVFSTLPKDIHVHFIIATHSPFIISDLPTECIIKLEGKNSPTNNTKYTKIRTYNGTDVNEEKYKALSKANETLNDEDKVDVLRKVYAEESKSWKTKRTFWANYINIINDWFFFEDKVLMWGLAESVIWGIAKDEREQLYLCNTNAYSDINKWKIWDDYLRDNLLYFVKNEKDAES